MFAKSVTMPVVVSAGGAATVKTPGPINGELKAIYYVADPNIPFVNAAFLITGATTGKQLLSVSAQGASNSWAPRQATHNSDGSASLYAAAGKAVNDRFALADESIQIAVSGAGNATQGQFIFEYV